MATQRVAQQSLRRFAAQPSGLATPMTRFASPAAIAAGRYMQFRPSTSSASSPSDPSKLLAEQRLRRPVSPHLSIYRPQITWYPSMFHRITGFIGSGALYLFAMGYLAAPLFGWQLGSASIAAAFGALPVAAKFLIKFTAALPVTFHSFNGIRHLIWDLGKQLTNKQVIVTGWTAVGLSAVTALLLALL
ncbi:hypothetical protein VTN49DRAFT_5225 [Thermomyces lanuginosus]|uniref:uncharacterized protein n=1 Tax=Thermomyces lanuginosus TaxID=5541 RepID=UPI003743607E